MISLYVHNNSTIKSNVCSSGASNLILHLKSSFQSEIKIPTSVIWQGRFGFLAIGKFEMISLYAVARLSKVVCVPKASPISYYIFEEIRILQLEIWQGIIDFLAIADFLEFT